MSAYRRTSRFIQSRPAPKTINNARSAKFFAARTRSWVEGRKEKALKELLSAAPRGKQQGSGLGRRLRVANRRGRRYAKRIGKVWVSGHFRERSVRPRPLSARRRKAH